jgi:hypothetical protein
MQEGVGIGVEVGAIYKSVVRSSSRRDRRSKVTSSALGVLGVGWIGFNGVGQALEGQTYRVLYLQTQSVSLYTPVSHGMQGSILSPSLRPCPPCPTPSLLTPS